MSKDNDIILSWPVAETAVDKLNNFSAAPVGSQESETEARSCNSPGTERNNNLLITNVLEIQSLPGDTNLASPGKLHFAIVLIIK